MTMINGFVDLRDILKRSTHPAAAHSREIQRQRWDGGGPVWEWYGVYGRYCHQHNDRQCRHPKA